MEEAQRTPKKKDKKKHKRHQPVTAMINLIGEKPGKSAPIVGYFPSGYDPVAAAAEAEDEAARVEVFKPQNQAKKRRLELVVRPPDSEVEFVGRSYTGEGANPINCVYALGVLDKATNILKIVPIAANKIIRLEPTIPGEEPLNQLVVKEDVSVVQKADGMKKLNQAFGTKKSVKMAMKQENLHQKHAPETIEVLDEKVRKLEKDKEALQIEGALPNGRGTPHYNIEATTPQQAYPLDKIILQTEWQHLTDILKCVDEGTSLDSRAYPTFVCNRVHRLKQIQDEAEKVKLGCILSYITHLIKYKDQNSIDCSSARGHRIPIATQRRFSTLFSPSEGRLSGGKVALLTSYVLVLTLHADDFRSDIKDIAKDLRMPPTTLRDHLSYLGVKIVTDQKAKAQFATLPIPLKFQTTYRKRKRGT